jgi:signal transduction histidine kinase
MQGTEYLETLLSSKDNVTVDALSRIKEGVRRADKIISSLYDFSRSPKLDIRPQDLNSILEDSLSSVENKYKAKDIVITREMKKNIPKAMVDRDGMEQVFINLLTNAIEALPEKGKIIIRTSERQLEERLYKVGERRDDYFKSEERVVVVELEDTGAGITEENINKVFNPFFTTKEIGKGVGLGLFISRGIVLMHKGMIDITSRPGRGTKVTVTLHMAPAQSDKKGDE